MCDSTAISYIFSNSMTFLYLGCNWSFSRYKRSAWPCGSFICLACSSCFLYMSRCQWRNWSSNDWIIGLVDIMVSSDELDVEGGIDRGLGGEGLLDNR